MKCGIVKLSTVAKYGNLSPRFYLGDDETKEKVARARKRTSEAQAALAVAEAEAQDEATRLALMAKNGEVKIDEQT